MGHDVEDVVDNILPVLRVECLVVGHDVVAQQVAALCECVVYARAVDVEPTGDGHNPRIPSPRNLHAACKDPRKGPGAVP